MRHRLTVLGAALAGSGYPNARNTVAMLAASQLFELADQASWLPGDVHLWKLARGPLREKRRIAWLLGSRSLLALYRLVRHARPGHWLYLPYPSLPVLWCLSWLPARYRPRCIADAYITLWDTLYQDRQLGSATSLTARLLHRAESRALRAAEAIVVDTQTNADHLATLYGVERQRIHALPLAIDPATLPLQGKHPSGTAGQAPVRVLFMGTFVPLQGTTVIAQAMALLRERSDIEFVLIGDGQQAQAAAPWLESHPGVTWLRDWQQPAVLAQELARADICLGVFGGAGKAARVLPFKLYLAMAAGKAIITQQQHSLPDQCPAPPLATCTPEPQALADAITALATDRQRRDALGHQAHAYYQQHLSAQALQQRWQQLLQ